MGGWMGGWVDGWVGVKAVLRIAYSNQKSMNTLLNLLKCYYVSYLFDN
jgi:hypothetical protein